MIPFYIDHDSSEDALVGELRRLGVDVLTSLEAGNARLPDAEQLAFASSVGRAIFSANVKDFARIHRDWMVSGGTHSGIVVRRDQLMPVGAQIRRLADIASRFPPDRMTNFFLYIDSWEVA